LSLPKPSVWYDPSSLPLMFDPDLVTENDICKES
jgi:hypothetical protein